MQKLTGRVVFSGGGGGDVFVSNADGSGLRRLTHEPGPEFDPSWSPTGRLIAFNSDRNFLPQIFVMRPDGSHPERITKIEGEYPAWSPDGTRFAYTTSKDNSGQVNDVGPYFDIHVMNADGTGDRRLIDIYGMFPVWSPDGAYIMFAGSRLPLSTESLWVVRPDGSGLARVEPGTMPDWIRG